MELRKYQIDLSDKAAEILKNKGLVYLNLEPRTGKTFTALETCKKVNAKNILFITKLKAFSSINADSSNYDFNLTVINKESIHKIEHNNFDVVIADEAHGLFATFPKPNNFYKIYKKRFGHLPVIFLSGTMSVESGSQIYHQFNASNNSPFKLCTNFYKWAKEYVKVKQKHVGYGLVNDYSNCDIIAVNKIIEPYTLKFTQLESGFSSKVNKIVLHHPISNHFIIDKLKKEGIVEGKDEVIIADTGVKLMQKIHQIENGSIIFESGNNKILNYSKAEFIKDYFEGKKLAIIYNFKNELTLLKEVFGNDITTDLNEFNNTSKHYVGQQVSSCEGISLAKADALVFYNFGYSGKNFIQAIDRLTLKDRLTNDVYFIFGKGSLTESIYRTVSKKENFNKKQFDDFRKQTTK
jgi:predicted helicase